MLVKEKLNRYQKGITLHTKSRKVRCLCDFPAPCLLFQFDVAIYILCLIILLNSISGIDFPDIPRILRFFEVFGRHFRDITNLIILYFIDDIIGTSLADNISCFLQNLKISPDCRS